VLNADLKGAAHVIAGKIAIVGGQKRLAVNVAILSMVEKPAYHKQHTEQGCLSVAIFYVKALGYALNAHQRNVYDP
jgi:hypothetical protein